MAANQSNVAYAKHQIRVVKTSTACVHACMLTASCYIPQRLYASEGKAPLVGVFGENDELRVEAFVSPSEDAEAEIRINGEWIAADKVYAVASD